jgi:hypothetical protein
MRSLQPVCEEDHGSCERFLYKDRMSHIVSAAGVDLARSIV